MIHRRRRLAVLAALSLASATTAADFPNHYRHDKTDTDKIAAYNNYRQRIALRRRDTYRQRSGEAAARYAALRHYLSDPHCSSSRTGLTRHYRAIQPRFKPSQPLPQTYRPPTTINLNQSRR